MSLDYFKSKDPNVKWPGHVQKGSKRVSHCRGSFHFIFLKPPSIKNGCVACLDFYKLRTKHNPMYSIYTRSRMRSEGSRFTLGAWGQSCVRQRLRFCLQTSATLSHARLLLKWFRQCVKWICVAVVSMAFAGEVPV